MKYGVVRINRKTKKMTLCYINHSELEYLVKDKNTAISRRTAFRRLFGDKNKYKLITLNDN